MTGPARTCDDLLRDDANMFIGHRRRPLDQTGASTMGGADAHR